jgi:hypothetical protein
LQRNKNVIHFTAEAQGLAQKLEKRAAAVRYSFFAIR